MGNLDEPSLSNKENDGCSLKGKSSTIQSSRQTGTLWPKDGRAIRITRELPSKAVRRRSETLGELETFADPPNQDSGEYLAGRGQG
jgi:hypothetical protein